VACAKSLKAIYSDRTRSLKCTHLLSIRNSHEFGATTKAADVILAKVNRACATLAAVKTGNQTL